MDLNYLYYRHQVSLFMADHASSGNARAAHRDLARGYARRIAEERRERRPVAA
jgi:hypothetical protein